MIGFNHRSQWVQYCFDRAVFTWGRWVENKLQERTKSGKLRHDLEDLLTAGTIEDYESGKSGHKYGNVMQLQMLLGDAVQVQRKS